MNSTRPIPAHVLGLLGLVGRGAVAENSPRGMCQPARQSVRVAVTASGRSRWHGPWGLTSDCRAVRPKGRV
jgi:hypothetical protein